MNAPGMRDWRSIAGVCGCLLAASAIALGAFGAHALRGHLDAPAMDLWRTATDFLLWNAMGMIVAALIPAGPPRWRMTATVAFLVGTGLFCGSLFALALGAPRRIGIITPLGGIAFLLGWASLAVLFARSSKPDQANYKATTPRQ